MLSKQLNRFSASLKYNSDISVTSLVSLCFQYTRNDKTQV